MASALPGVTPSKVTPVLPKVGLGVVGFLPLLRRGPGGFFLLLWLLLNLSGDQSDAGFNMSLFSKERRVLTAIASTCGYRHTFRLGYRLCWIVPGDVETLRTLPTYRYNWLNCSCRIHIGWHHTNNWAGCERDRQLKMNCYP